MYCPAHFLETRLPVLHQLMAQHPLATIITQTDQGLSAEHIPLLLRTTASGADVLVGHVAASNPLAASSNLSAAATGDVLVVFQGPDAYVSPNWYATKPVHGQVVPTWNYAVVHAHGHLRTVNDDTWKLALLTELTATHEQHQPQPWAVTDAPAAYVQRLLGAIVGIEIQVTSLSGKWKVSQNQPAINRASVVQGLNQAGTADQRGMAALVEQFGPAL
jgi:transcriptional regulator